MRSFQWPTVLVFFGVYAALFLLTFYWAALPTALLFVLGGLASAWHGSYQHEVIHGHPTRWGWLNRFSALPPVLLWLPYDVYALTHHAHHVDEVITDPFEDPESFYLAQEKWEALPIVAQKFMMLLNTLMGRLVLGPFVNLVLFWRHEGGLVWQGEPGRRAIWAEHMGLSVLLLTYLTLVCAMPIWLYLVCFAFPGTALLMMRSFLEHQWAAAPKARTAIVEAGWFWRVLYLNNTYHAVHHRHPAMPWFALGREYSKNREDYQQENEAYVLNGYREVALRYAWRAKEPVRHPRR